MPNLRWELPTTKMRFNLGERNLEEGDAPYKQWTCEETIDETTGEPVLTRIVSDTSKPAIEIYDTTADCVTQATTNYAYYKGAVPVVMFSAVLLLILTFAFIRWGPEPRLYATMVWLALAMELWGTYLGNWTWASTVPHTGLTAWNPPLLVGAFYCFGDLLVNLSVAKFEGQPIVQVEHDVLG